MSGCFFLKHGVYVHCVGENKQKQNVFYNIFYKTVTILMKFGTLFAE